MEITTSLTVPEVIGTSGGLILGGTSTVDITTGASVIGMTDTAISLTSGTIEIGDDSDDTVKIRPGTSAGADKILQCTDATGTSTWIDYGVFDSAGNRLI